MGSLIDLTGKTFGRLKVEKRVYGFKNSKQACWECVCICGNKLVVEGAKLRNGNTTSCGCYRKEQLLKANTKHGMCHSKLMHSWYAMRERCLNPNAHNYERYGGRGIKICKEWDNSEVFVDWALENGYKEGLSLDRIDTNGDYTPRNCRWATKTTQANNKTSNINITHQGKTQTLKQWCDELDLYYPTISSRINQSKWDPLKAITTPPQKNQFG